MFSPVLSRRTAASVRAVFTYQIGHIRGISVAPQSARLDAKSPSRDGYSHNLRYLFIKHYAYL